MHGQLNVKLINLFCLLSTSELYVFFLLCTVIQLCNANQKDAHFI